MELIAAFIVRNSQGARPLTWDLLSSGPIPPRQRRSFQSEPAPMKLAPKVKEDHPTAETLASAAYCSLGDYLRSPMNWRRNVNMFTKSR